MTYELAKHYYWRFENIHSAWDANVWLGFRSREKDEMMALRYYMAERGCLSKDGKYWQWYGVNLKTKEIIKATIRIEGVLSYKSIERQAGFFYVPAYDEYWALKEAERKINGVE